MRAARARYVATIVATAAATVGSLLGSVPSAHAASAPWEPDPNANAGIVFFDASGHQITSGSASASPMAAYAVATGTIESGDNTAILYAALPQSGNTAKWSREQLSSPTAYPASGAPSSVGSGPTVTGASSDESLATFASHFPSSSGVYQIRIRTENSSGSGVQSTKYAAADVLVSGGKWTEVYPKNATAASTITNTGKPKLSGTHKVGTIEKCSHGSWTPTPSSYTYQWYKGSSKIKGATKPKLKLTAGLKGKSIHCKVTAHKSGFSKASASSKSVKVT